MLDSIFNTDDQQPDSATAVLTPDEVTAAIAQGVRDLTTDDDWWRWRKAVAVGLFSPSESAVSPLCLR